MEPQRDDLGEEEVNKKSLFDLWPQYRCNVCTKNQLFPQFIDVDAKKNSNSTLWVFVLKIRPNYAVVALFFLFLIFFNQLLIRIKHSEPVC